MADNAPQALAAPPVHPAAPVVAPFTVANAMYDCGITDATVFQGISKAERIASEVFDDDFSSCMDKTYTDLDDDLKSYSMLTVTNGQIRLTPGQKKNIKAFIQWTRDQIRLGLNPAHTRFPTDESADYIRRYKHHEAYIAKSKTITDTAKPQQFTEKLKWTEWYPTLVNFLRAIPGRNGVPLSYVIRPDDDTILQNYGDFIDEYVDRAPLEGRAFLTDAAEVHTYVAKFMTNNTVAEAKLAPHVDEKNGRSDINALKNHYEGVGVHAINIVKADKVLNDLFYSGEKPPHMWWDEFERQLTDAFNAYDRHEGRMVHSEYQKLRILNRKVTADFLQATKASINIDLARVPITITYENALAAFRNQVNQKFPPEMASASRRTRRVNEVSARGGGSRNYNNRHRGGRGVGYRGGGRHSGRSRYGGRHGGSGRGYGGRNAGYRRSRQDARMVQCHDGTQIEVHPAYDFTSDEWQRLPEAERRRIREERSRYKRSRGGGRDADDGTTISEISVGGRTAALQDHLRDFGRRIQELDTAVADTRSTTPIDAGTVMGGRNDQASIRSRNSTSGNRTIRAVKVMRISSNFSSAYHSLGEPLPGTSAVNEMDSNADTCCLGSNFIVLAMTQRTADVYHYDLSYKTLHNVPIVTGATTVTDTVSGKSFIMVINEALYYGKKLDHSLINPNQFRHHGTMVWDNPYDPYHDLSIDIDDCDQIGLTLDGTKVGFTSHAPTDEELRTLPHIEVTSKFEWNPKSVQLIGKVSGVDDDCQCWQPNKHLNLSQNTKTGDYTHSDNTSDEAILHSINSVLVDMGSSIMRKVSEIITPIADEIPARRTFISHGRHLKATAESIADLWCIGLKRAKATLTATTQRGIRSAILPIARRYRADRVLQMRRLNARFATDTLFSDVKSLNQNTCAQVYSHKVGFNAVYPMTNSTGDSLGYSFRDFCDDFGIPEHLTFDGYSSQVGRNTMFMKSIRKYNTLYHISSPRRPNENPAEGSIRELKKRWYRIMLKMKVPERLWDYGLVWIAETGNLSVSSSRYANGRTSIEYITGETPDISEYLDFTFYDWITYRANAGLGELALGRWLGVSHKVGQAMSFWILPVSGIPISCVTVQRLTRAEKTTDEWKERMKDFDEKIAERLDIKESDLSRMVSNVDGWNKLSISEEDPGFMEEFNRVINDAKVPHGADDYVNDREDEVSLVPMDDKEPFHEDSYINMEIGLPRGDDDSLVHAIVKKRKVDDEGNAVGIASNNPLTDTRAYEVEFIDGTTEVITANIIAENLLAQVDEEGHRQMMLDEIIDYRKLPSAMRNEDAFTTTSSGMRRRKMTTRGWEICAQWKDGSTDWIALKDLKESYPVELADFAKLHGIHEEPAFAWWVPHVEKKKKIIISKLKSKYWQRTHKYGIKIPKSVEEAYELDKQNGNKLWTNGIIEEMNKVKIAVQESNTTPDNLIGYQEIALHMIFDIKLGENFRRKARMVAGGHTTKTPSSVTYSSVVSRDSVRIMLMIAALNNLDLQAADIENAYLTAPCREKIWTRAGPEFGMDEGKIFIIVRALYGLKSSGAAFRAFLAERLDEMGFTSSLADPDVWFREAKKEDGEEYYEYILVYVDDLLAISANARDVMLEVAETFKLKKGKIEPPEVYLGGRLEKKQLNGKGIWTMSSVDYVKAIIKNVEVRLQEKGRILLSRATTPMSSDYKPELDGTHELDSDDITMYQELIGELRWAIEIGRVDILHEVSVLSSYQAAPREGHLEQLLHIFAFLKKHPKLTLYFDPSYANIDPSSFTGSTAKEFQDQYRGAKEEIPKNRPKPRGRLVQIVAFVDAAHASDKITRRSHTGYIIFVNRAPIIWYSKRQTTVESSTFSSEYIALKTCVEHIIGIRFKLMMFGIPIDGEARVLNDNKSVVDSSSKLEHTLNKKHSSIAYHLVRWNVAAEVIRIGWIEGISNIADALTKRLTAARRSSLFGDWTY